MVFSRSRLHDIKTRSSVCGFFIYYYRPFVKEKEKKRCMEQNILYAHQSV